MNTTNGRDGTSASAALEPQLSSWLRGFDPGEAPVRLRVRISRDLRAEGGRPGRRPLRLSRDFGSIAASVLLFAGLALVLLASLRSGLGSSVGGSTTPLLPQPALPSPDVSVRMGGWNPMLIAALLAIAALAAVMAPVLPLRRFAGWIAGNDLPSSIRRMPRGLAEVPWLAVVLSLACMGVMIWEYLLWEPVTGQLSSPGFYFSIFLSLAVAPIVALRYARSDRSGRWLLLGGMAIAIAQLPGLLLGTAGSLRWFDGNDLGNAASDLYPFATDSFVAVGWLSLAIGVGLRSGPTTWPRRRFVALGAGIMAALLLWTVISTVDYVTAMMLSVGVPVYPFEMLRFQFGAITSLLVTFAWFWLLWVAIRCCRSGGIRSSWALLAAGSAAQVVLATLLFMYTLSSAFQFDWQMLTYLGWSSSVLLLLALVVGLNPTVSQSDENGLESGRALT